MTLDKTDIINITVFTNAGGIIVPVLFGAFFLNEKIDLPDILSCILLTIVVIIPLFSKKNNKKTSFLGYFLCVLLFFEAGAATVVYKLYAIAKNVADTNVFCFWCNFIMLIYLIPTSLKNGKNQIIEEFVKTSPKAYFRAVLSVICLTSTTLFGILALEKISITVYTLTTGSLGLIFSTVFSQIIFSEKITKRTALFMLLSIVAIILNDRVEANS